MRFLLMIMLYTLLFSIVSSCSRENNQLDLTFDSATTRHDVKIRMEVLGSVPVTEIYNGNTEFAIPNGYGENEWRFTYKDTLQAYIRHFKTNRNDRHSYKFTFREEKGKYFVDVDIKGASPLKLKEELKSKQR